MENRENRKKNRKQEKYEEYISDRRAGADAAGKRIPYHLEYARRERAGMLPWQKKRERKGQDGQA